MGVFKKPGAQSRTRDLLFAWGPVIVWMAMVYYFSSQSALGGMEMPPIFQALRKSAHIVEYAGLGLLTGYALVVTWCGSLRAARRSDLLRAWWLGAAIATLYAATDEFHQSFVPNRGAHLADVIIDMLSAVAGLGIAYIWLTRNRPATSPTPDLENK